MTNNGIEVDILGIKFIAYLIGDDIIALKPQGKWSMSRSTSSAKEVLFFKRGE